MERPSQRRDLTQEELAHIADTATCPYCHGSLYAGPRGGLSVNLRCDTKRCHARFNYSTEGDHAFAGEYIGVDDSPLSDPEGAPSLSDHTVVSVFVSPLSPLPQLAPPRPSLTLVMAFAAATMFFGINVCLTWWYWGSPGLIGVTIMTLVYAVQAFRSYRRDRKAYREFMLTVEAVGRLQYAIIEFVDGPQDRR